MPTIRNIFACLVHESQDCVVDLVRNLKYLDPSSVILLYNGGKNSKLLTGSFPFERYGAVVHPRPRPLSWGRLHEFALDCMHFALQHYHFDTLTIVDSDQLLLRKGYSDYLARFLAGKTGIGLLGNSPGVMTENTAVGPATAAFRERGLWRPFLQRFPDGEQKFVHWTFWPSTVFTADVARELVELFAKDRQLKALLRQTKIWATEEVILPTLVALLDFGVTANPCSYDFVKYQKRYSLSQLNVALHRPDVYWVHPVRRQDGDPLRQHIRTHLNHYVQESSGSGQIISEVRDEPDLLLSRPIFERMKRIKGWLEEDEADLLIAALSQVLRDLPRPQAIVEVGSYCGRSTVVLGSVIKTVCPEARLYAIDPHEGKVGAVDRGIKTHSATLAKFRRNITGAGLKGVVELIQKCSTDVEWDKPIGLLLIDGMHDYANVARDFFHFEPWVVPEGLIAFHDYADYYPGVKAFVDELLATGPYKKVGLVHSMMVVRRLAEEGGQEDYVSLRAPHSHQLKELSSSAASIRRDAHVAVRSCIQRPFVSCIMPTLNRRVFLSQAIGYFLRQDYANSELIIVDDGSDPVADLIPEDPRIRYLRLESKLSLGAKRNLACDAARGEIVVHWDDDDWMADYRLSYQVESLLKAKADLCGLTKVLFFDPYSSQSWQYEYPRKKTLLLAGGTLCYRKQFWETNPFHEVNVGEDSRFVWSDRPKKIVTPGDNSFYVALIHPGNTNPRKTCGSRWAPYPRGKIRHLLGNDWSFYTNLTMDWMASGKGSSAKEAHIEISRSAPLVSCIMPTRDRLRFVARAVKYFQRQTYTNRELIIVDDGSDVVAQGIPDDQRIRYIRLQRKATVGYKRNVAVRESRGEIIAHWDDDDWYSENRIDCQVQSLLNGKAMVCGLKTRFFYNVPRDVWWSCTPVLHAKMFFADVNGRSLMYVKKLWEEYGHYPDVSLAEDAQFLRQVLLKNVKIVRNDNANIFVYIRHHANLWAFDCGNFIAQKEWKSVPVPSFMSKGDLLFYRGLLEDSH